MMIRFDYHRKFKYFRIYEILISDFKTLKCFDICSNFIVRSLNIPHVSIVVLRFVY